MASGQNSKHVAALGTADLDSPPPNLFIGDSILSLAMFALNDQGFPPGETYCPALGKETNSMGIIRTKFDSFKFSGRSKSVGNPQTTDFLRSCG